MKKISCYITIGIVICLAIITMPLFSKSYAHEMTLESAQNVVEIQNKTLDSITLNVTPSQGVYSFRIYNNNELLTTTNETSFTISNIVNGTTCNVQVEFLNEQGDIVETKNLDSVSTAIQINSFTESTTLPKNTYYFNATTIPENVVVNVDAGSIIKINKESILFIDGSLNLNGTEFDRITLTCQTDSGIEQKINISDYWYNIRVGINGKFMSNYAEIKHGGYSSSMFASYEWIYSRNEIELKNTVVKNMLYIINSEGKTAKINNCNLDTGISMKDTSHVSLNENIIKGFVSVYETSGKGKNHTKITNNIIKNSNISYTPNQNSTVEIKNNEIENYGQVPIYLQLFIGNNNILNNISGNRNIDNIKYPEIHIASFWTTKGVYDLPKRVYSMASIPENIQVNVEAGSMIKLVKDESLIVNGELKLNGTEADNVIITSFEDIGLNYTINTSNYWDNIRIGTNGKFISNYGEIKYGGNASSFSNRNCIYSSNETELNHTNIKEVINSITAINNKIKINNCNIGTGLYLNGASDIDVENTTFESGISIYHTVGGVANHTKIVNNIIENNTNGNGRISYTPNQNSTVDIRDNKIKNYDGIPIDVGYTYGSSDLLNGVSGNISTEGLKHPEINIISFSTNVGSYNLPKRVYGLPSIPENVIVNMQAGSMIKIPKEEGPMIYGQLNLNGTEEDKVIITAVEDTGLNQTISKSNYWYDIRVGINGKFTSNYAEIKYGGYYPSNFASREWLYSRNEIEINNTSVKNMLYGIDSKGKTLKINNCNIDSTINSKDTVEISIANSEINNSFSIASGGNVNVINNTVNNTIYYSPYENAIATIKDNKVKNSYCISVDMHRAPATILKNIYNNSNINNDSLSGTYINGSVGSCKLYNTSKILLSMVTVKKDEVVEIEKNTHITLLDTYPLNIEGTLLCNGTNDEPITIQTQNKSGYNRESYMNINQTGKALINNAIFDTSNINIDSIILNSGTLYLLNSELSRENKMLQAISFGPTAQNNIIKYNKIYGRVSNNSGITQDLTYNYWGTTDGPTRVENGTTVGSGPQIPSNSYGVPFNTEFLKTDLSYTDFLPERKEIAREHFGQAGINGYTGNYSKTYSDFSVEIPNLDLSLDRTYNSKDTEIGDFGKGWSFGLKSKVVNHVYNQNIKYIYLPNGSMNIFEKQSNGNYTGANTRNQLSYANEIYTLTTKAGSIYQYDLNGNLYQVTDKYGNITTINVGVSGHINSIVDYAGREYQIQYTNDKISKIIDPLGRSTNYIYDAKGMLVQVGGVNGKSVHYEYNEQGFLSKITEINDDSQEVVVEELTYYTTDNNDLGKVKTIKNEHGKIDTYVYNEDSRSTVITDQNNRTKKQSFDTKGYIIKQEEANGLVTNISYNLVDAINKYGEIANKTDYTGKTMVYTYDANGNVLTEKVNDTTKTYTYNNKNNMTKKTDENGNYIEYTYAADGITLLKEKYMDASEINYEYNEQGIKGLIKSKTNQNSKTTSYEYDAYGNVAKETDSLGNITIYEYNKIGWLLSKTSPRGTITTYTYDNAGNNTKIVENGIQTTNEFNYKNNIVKTTNGNQNAKIYEYNKAPKLIKLTDEEGNSTTYEYDTYGNMIKENKANGISYLYEYDVLNNRVKKALEKNNGLQLLEEITYSYANGNTTKTAKTYQDATAYTTSVEVKDFRGNVTKNQKQDAIFTYNYDNAGRMTSKVDEIGKNTIYSYDNLNRVIKQQEEIETNLFKVTSYEYDAVGNVQKEKIGKEKVELNQEASSYIVTNYTYDGNNNVILTTNSSGQEEKYHYDSENNKIKEEIKIADGKYKVTEYSYNYANKVILQKEWIEKSSVEGNSLNNNELTALETSYTYDNMNNKITETLPDTTIITYTYNKNNKETKKSVTKNGKTISEEKVYDTQGNVIAQTDGNGNTTIFNYDAQNHKTREEKPNQVITTYEYDLAGNLVSEILPNRTSNIQYVYNLYNQPITKKVNYSEGEQLHTITTTYEYDNLDHLLKETTEGKTLEYSYNKAGKCISKKDGRGNTITYEYDAQLNLVKETKSDGSITTQTFDERGNVLSTKIDNVIQEEYVYDLISNKINEKDELQNEIIHTYDSNGNLVTTEEVESGYLLHIQYNPLKQAVKKVDNSNLEKRLEYDMLGNIVKEIDKKQDGNEQIVLSYEYDNVSNKTKEVDGNGNTTTYTYDENNHKIQEKNALNQTTTYTYDKNGNNTSKTNYLGNVTTYIYDALDRMIESKDAYSNVIERREYDTLGRQTKSIDASNHSISYTYDNNDNILTKTDEEGHIESYEYDSNDNKTKYTDRKGNVTKYEYDVKGNLLKVINALNKATSYTYDNAGNLLTQTDAKGNVTQYQYDKRSNETKKIDQLGNEETKVYNKNNHMISYTTNNEDTFSYEYDVFGRLVKEAVNNKETTYHYDNNNNLLQTGDNEKTYDSLNRVLTDNQNGQTVNYEYLDNNNKVIITDAKGNTKQEEYDKVDRLQKVISGEETTEYLYNANGSLQKKVTQQNITEYEYYPDKQIKSLTTKDSNGNIITSNHYEYDNNNNQTKDNEKTFAYDALDRIKAVNGIDTYTYDDVNNITSKKETDGAVKAYTYNAKNELTRTVSEKNLEILEDTTYTYDNNGNQLTSTAGNNVITNVYNEKNELVQVKKNNTQVASYTYDTLGKRTEKVTDETTKYIYDGTKVILELGNANEEKAVNTYGLELLARKQDETKHYYIYNGHGDVTSLVDTANTKVNTYE
ncbi:MAG: DUF6531 domain-containing protein, partial [Clostridia bacterium]|nr:DUF6531 domain-containing protein [Clostridia bacterium]